MTYRELSLLALLVGREVPQLLFASASSGELQFEYWLAGKLRNDQWMRLLKAAEESLADPDKPPSLAFTSTAAEGLAVEIFATELLSRVWAAISCGWDHLGHEPQLEPLAHSVLMGHLQVIARARQLLTSLSQHGRTHQRVTHVPEIVAGWTDQLIGWVGSWVPVTHYAADPDRAAEFATEWRTQGRQNPVIWKLLRNLMEHRLAGLPEGLLATREMNRRIGTAILGVIPRSVVCQSEFASLFLPYWVDQFAGRMQGLIDRAVAEA